MFITGRGRNSSGVGASVVAGWSETLPGGGTVLDLGCGTGVPISQVLIERGFKVYGVDASPTIVAAFRARFPGVPVECADVEDSDFFTRTFDGVVAWGLFFLLDAEVQRGLIKKFAGVLQSGGRLLFTAPNESGSFPPDVMTGRPQFSLATRNTEKRWRPKACRCLEHTVMKAKTTTTLHTRCNSRDIVQPLLAIFIG